MKAKTEFVANFKDIEQAHQLGYDVPEPETTIIDFNFDITGVVAYYINNDGNINLSLYGEMWTVQYDKKIIEKQDGQFTKIVSAIFGWKLQKDGGKKLVSRMP